MRFGKEYGSLRKAADWLGWSVNQLSNIIHGHTLIGRRTETHLREKGIPIDQWIAEFYRATGIAGEDRIMHYERRISELEKELKELQEQLPPAFLKMFYAKKKAKGHK